jgi:deoxyribodipyrimidine photo-lyase
MAHQAFRTRRRSAPLASRTRAGYKECGADVNTVLVLLTRDLRTHDHPALAAAAATAERVVPAFVIDDRLLACGFARPNRLAFLLDSLADLDTSLARRGARLVIRRGDVAEESMRLARATGAGAIFTSADVSGYARARERRLGAACGKAGLEFRTFPGLTVAPPGTLRPSSGGDHFRVFTPYWNSWRRAALRPLAPTSARLSLPSGLTAGRLPRLEELTRGRPSPDLPPGGETAGRARLAAWLRGGLDRYEDTHDRLQADATSRLGPYLHLGCVSAREIVGPVQGRAGAEAFLRQLCWRDFCHQVTAAFPAIARKEYRPRGDRWRRDPRALEAWKAGRTGYPIVDAAMRQLAREGFMPNRARLIAASFLVKDLGVDWRLGAAHFLDLLVDGDAVHPGQRAPDALRVPSDQGGRQPVPDRRPDPFWRRLAVTGRGIHVAGALAPGVGPDAHHHALLDGLARVGVPEGSAERDLDQPGVDGGDLHGRQAHGALRRDGPGPPSCAPGSRRRRGPARG